MELLPIPTGMWVLFTLAVVISTLCHWRIHRFWRALLTSIIATPIVFFFASWIQEGRLPEPFAAIAFVLFAGISLIISALVGSIFFAQRQFRNSRSSGA
jgi:predicted PurR-regulated permease PerM